VSDGRKAYQSTTFSRDDSDDSRRYTGEIILLGGNIESVVLEAHRLPQEYH